MPSFRSLCGCALICAVVLAGAEVVAAPVDAQRIGAAADNRADWLTHGRTYDEQRFSPLAAIDQGNVKDLKLAWYFDLDTKRGQEATPLVVDGTMYVTSAWSKVFALDARTGKEKWRFDPQVVGDKAIDACCDVVNRGVAAWGRSVFVGTLDGRLIALDMRSGKPLWSVQTTDPKKRYTITGAPRVIKGKVIIGNGGGEMGVRGYVSAYDAITGKMLWRFYTVPGNPQDGFENPQMERAAKTWHGEWWKYGGGGTVWDSMAYDPQLDMLYVGVGNGSPWNHRIRSNGEGDNLFLSSILALKPDTGEYVWHFQSTPAESWDYTATQHIILADLTIDGRRAQSRDAGAEERLFLRARPRHRRIHLGQELRQRDVDDRARSADGSPGDDPGGALPARAGDGRARPGRRAQLVPDVVQPADRPGVHPGAGVRELLQAR